MFILDITERCTVKIIRLYLSLHLTVVEKSWGKAKRFEKELDFLA